MSQLKFQRWLQNVDEYVYIELGMHLVDFPDEDYWMNWDNGVTFENMAQLVIKNQLDFVKEFTKVLDSHEYSFTQHMDNIVEILRKNVKKYYKPKPIPSSKKRRSSQKSKKVSWGGVEIIQTKPEVVLMTNVLKLREEYRKKLTELNVTKKSMLDMQRDFNTIVKHTINTVMLDVTFPQPVMATIVKDIEIYLGQQH